MLALLPALFSAGCRTQGTTTPVHETQSTVVDDGALGPGDVFAVRVFGEDELSGTYQVEHDGSIRYPFLGTIQVRGKAPSEVAEMVAKGLRDGEYLKAPQVSVLVEESNSKMVSVMGAVRKPGTFPVTAGLTVLQAVTLAGGLTSLADRDHAVLTRREEEGLKRYQVPFSEVMGGRKADIPLRPGDIVFVPERLF